MQTRNCWIKFLQDPKSRPRLLYKKYGICIDKMIKLDKYLYSDSYLNMNQGMLTCCTQTGPPKPTKTGQQPYWIQTWREESQDTHETTTQHPPKLTGGSQVVNIQPQTPSKSMPMSWNVHRCASVYLSISMSSWAPGSVCVSEVSNYRSISLSSIGPYFFSYYPPWNQEVAPENRTSENESSLPTIHFQVLCQF